MKLLRPFLIVLSLLGSTAFATAHQFYVVVVEWPSTVDWQTPVSQMPKDAKLVTKAILHCVNGKTTFAAKGKDDKYVLELALELGPKEEKNANENGDPKKKSDEKGTKEKTATLTFLLKTPNDLWSFTQSVQVNGFQSKSTEPRILSLVHSPAVTRAVLLWISD